MPSESTEEPQPSAAASGLPTPPTVSSAGAGPAAASPKAVIGAMAKTTSQAPLMAEAIPGGDFDDDEGNEKTLEQLVEQLKASEKAHEEPPGEAAGSPRTRSPTKSPPTRSPHGDLQDPLEAAQKRSMSPKRQETPKRGESQKKKDSPKRSMSSKKKKKCQQE